MQDAGIPLVSIGQVSNRATKPVRGELFGMLDQHWDSVSGTIRTRFTTQHFRDLIRKMAPNAWAELERRYGPGGKGSGNYYSPANILFNYLRDKERQGLVAHYGYVPSDKDWGSHLVAQWGLAGDDDFPLTDEEREFWEGKLELRTHLVRERARGLRRDVINANRVQGLRCEMCGVSGEYLSDDFRDALFEVHHSKSPFAAGDREKKVKVSDMSLLCACCHRLLHRMIKLSNRWMSPAEGSKHVQRYR